jgi:hypothetical protein
MKRICVDLCVLWIQWVGPASPEGFAVASGSASICVICGQTGWMGSRHSSRRVTGVTVRGSPERRSMTEP